MWRLLHDVDQFWSNDEYSKIEDKSIRITSQLMIVSSKIDFQTECENRLYSMDDWYVFWSALKVPNIQYPMDTIHCPCNGSHLSIEPIYLTTMFPFQGRRQQPRVRKVNTQQTIQIAISGPCDDESCWKISKMKKLISCVVAIVELRAALLQASKSHFAFIKW